LFPSPEQLVVCQTGRRKFVGQAGLSRGSCPVAVRSTCFTRKKVTRIVAKAGQRDFLLESVGTVQDWLLPDYERGKLIFGVLYFVFGGIDGSFFSSSSSS
jgi:hypothetical protein